MDYIPSLKYCLYARKSSESDERQAMSIESQVKEMQELAVRDAIDVVEIKRESHSAKASGARPLFGEVLTDLRNEKYNAILTWAPDRLSRNAGDLGSLVDLMDQKKLIKIQTYSQSFCNTPNEKFLLMILCSQAKLENDQKGLNVKRGIRAKCEMGWRPGPPPIGYFNRSFAGVKDIVVDPDRSHIITEMFHRVAEKKESGRTIARWLSKIGFTTRAGKIVPLSVIYTMLKNPFYYGEYKYPISSDKWYKGKHKPLITKEIFDQVQIQLIVPKKSKWGGRQFAFKDVLKCASCGSNIVGEEKYRKRKDRPPKKHIYYHCSRQVKYECPEPYTPEEDLSKELIKYIALIEKNNPDELNFGIKLQTQIDTYRNYRDEILIHQDVDPDKHRFIFSEYVKHTMRVGSLVEKNEVARAIKRQLYLHNRSIISSPLI